MATRSAAFPLGDLLSLTTGYVMTMDYPDALINLVRHTVNAEITPVMFPAAVEDVKVHLLAKLPWLYGITVPDWMREEPTNLKLWCWLDTKEQRYGRLHVVESMESDEWEPPEITAQIHYVGPDGEDHECSFEELPEAVKAFLRQQGFDPES